MHGESPIIRRIGRLITAETSDPRPPQLAFLLPVVTLLAVMALVEPEPILEPVFLAGLALVAVATVAAFLVPWPRFDRLAIVAVPLVDLVAIALMRLLPNVGAVAALVVFPAVWLGLVFERRGVWIAIVASVVTLTVPGFFHYGFGLDGWSRALLLPIISGIAAFSTGFMAEVWRVQRQRLEQQGGQLQSLLREVTQRRQITDAIVEAVDVGLLAIDRDGVYTSMNPRHQEFLRLSFPDGHDGVAGQTGYVYGEDQVTEMPAEDMPSVRAARGEAFSDYVIWVGKEPSERRALSVSSRPVHADGGEVDGAVLAYKDITDLMRALHVKDEFVASVSHELRTPLTSILGYTDLIAEHGDELPADVNRHISVVHRNAERLLLLVSYLLSTAQIESGSLRMSPEPTDLAEVVRQCIAAVESRAGTSGIRLHASVDDVPPVIADAARIGQVVDNLLSNAVKYTLPGGEVAVRLSAEEGEVHLEVRDTGIGMSPTDLDQVFTKFFRARTAEERAIPGVGLGLVITKAIVDAHHGRLAVDSTEGVGTTARVSLRTVAA